MPEDIHTDGRLLLRMQYETRCCGMSTAGAHNCHFPRADCGSEGKDNLLPPSPDKPCCYRSYAAATQGPVQSTTPANSQTAIRSPSLPAVVALTVDALFYTTWLSPWPVRVPPNGKTATAGCSLSILPFLRSLLFSYPGSFTHPFLSFSLQLGATILCALATSPATPKALP